MLADRVEGAALVLSSRFSLNLLALTLEQVQSKRRKLLADASANMLLEAQAEHPRRLSSYSSHGRRWTSLSSSVLMTGGARVGRAHDRRPPARCARAAAAGETRGPQ